MIQVQIMNMIQAGPSLEGDEQRPGPGPRAFCLNLGPRV